MRPQPTAHPTPTVVVYTVNGRAVRDYLTSDPEPPRWLVGELDGHRVVWAAARHRTSCARHPTIGGCPCVHLLGRLATPDALAGWWQALGWRERRRLHTTARTITGTPGGPRREPPTWTWGLGHRLILAAAALALLLLLAPLLHGR
jgi:hypothetical protein